MPERQQSHGRALRAYQVVLVLVIGWLAGRLPQILADEEAETARLMAAIGPEADSPAQTVLADAEATAAQIDTANLAAEIAARVAAQVANETVSRLIAAGWGPRMPPQQIVIQGLPGGYRPAEATVRIVTEPHGQLARIDYDLPAGAPKPPEPRPDPAGPAGAAAPAVAALQAHAMATRGYAALRAGDRRSGAQLLGEAIGIAPDAPEAAAWIADVQRLTRRWSISAYTLARSGGLGDPLAASPVLGGGQSGAA
ncbi:MAG: hypothetical protein KGZ61_04660, partial [Sandarakinorhabdus sp.]|nr:hypothetical protein [Sandarakinorhabdus sp.]